MQKNDPPVNNRVKQGTNCAVTTCHKFWYSLDDLQLTLRDWNRQEKFSRSKVDRLSRLIIVKNFTIIEHVLWSQIVQLFFWMLIYLIYKWLLQMYNYNIVCFFHENETLKLIAKFSCASHIVRLWNLHMYILLASKKCGKLFCSCDFVIAIIINFPNSKLK